MLEAKLEKHNELWHEYHVIQTKIDELLPEAEVAEREKFEDAFFTVQAAARSKLARTTDGTMSAQINLQAANTNQGIVSANQTPVRLPVISLQTFDGDYGQWQQFHDTFQALVNDNMQLNSVQKFHYLKSALSGCAAQVIHSLQTTNENYSIALELLTKRFSNLRLTIHQHVHELFDTPPILRESTELRALSDNFQKHLRVLQQLKEPVDKWDTLIIYLVTSKLDPTTKKEWELKVIQEKASTVKQLMEFLDTRCQFLEALHPARKVVQTKISTQKSNQANANKSHGTTLAHVATSEAVECALCKQAHRIHTCKVFRELSVESRRNETKRLKLCYNCLSQNHVVQKCTSRMCKHCSKRYHTLLHADERTDTSDKGAVSSSNSLVDSNGTINQTEKPTTTSVSMKSISSCGSSSEVLLSTAIVYIRDNEGKFHKARALLDNGSQSNFVTKSLCQRLKLDVNRIKHMISGLSISETPIIEITQTTIASTTTAYKTDVSLLIVDQITRSIPLRPINIKSLSLPQCIELADPMFHRPQNVDLLLGATIFWDTLETEKVQLGARQPILQSTKLGWLLCGQIGSSVDFQSHQNFGICGLVQNDKLQVQVEKFWRIEDMPNTTPLSREEVRCEELFRDGYKRTTNGRFEVSLPFREDPNILGESKSIALKRLRHLERKFQRDPQLQARYIGFMEEYLRLGHMSLLPNIEGMKINYLPHHAVFKEELPSTKFRVVFDASSPTTSGKSLNDCLLVGPTIQPELFEILLRFRQHHYVLTGDITKYRQIMIKPAHRLYQCILWRWWNSEDPATTFSLNTVTYGTASAPFLATHSLQQLSFDCEATHPHAAAIINRDFYVDDLITGESSIQELLETKLQVTNILKAAGFELTKFRSNIPLGQDECLDQYGLTDTKVLGLLWRSTSDSLIYEAALNSTPEIITKRNMLSVITQIFDPLGLVGPVIIKAKILLQSLWQQKLDWDTPVPETIRIAWSSYCQQLPTINSIVRPRHALLHNSCDIQLHGFCDPSQVAYGACIYLRSVNDEGIINVQLLTAKSRVAPLKTVSLPRLELCGAVLLVNLLQKVTQALTCKIPQRHLWTDSEVMLAWIRGEPSKWQTFVRNRTAEIQRSTNKQDWAHVSSETNPADLISRGLLPEQLVNAILWWEGPPWLKEIYTQWPKTMVQLPIEVPETRTLSHTLLNVNSFDVISRYSSLTKLKRVIALCNRFKTNCMLSKKKSALVHGPCTAEELQQAMIVLLKLHQQEAFANELHELQRGKDINLHSRILSLSPVIDRDGLLRVGGRLRNAPLTYSQKHPILLSSRGILTDLIIRDQHLNHFHIGPQLLLATLRENYWIIRAKDAVKRVLSKCVLCFRMRPHSPVQKMGDLPACRITPSRAFKHTGVDYAGPFSIKISRNKSGKAYLCLFVCMATKAIHLELVSDLTTEMFLNALKRFISRRGKCDSILSDNGKNFLGAKNVMQRIGDFLSHPETQAKVTDFASNQGITWKFIPPHSPHMGGLWEANVKSVKIHLRSVINDTPLTFEELYTVLTQIEAILNSRPLCPLSNAPDELEVLTSGHFLMEGSLLAVPEESVLDVPTNRLSRYQMLSQLQQSFWKRWSTEYVAQMQQRAKWRSAVRTDEIQIGKLALIRDDNLPPLKWRTGKICELHPGSDRLIRVVSLKTTGGIIRRSLQKICILPVD